MTMIDLRPLQVWKTRDILTCHILIFLEMSYCMTALFSRFRWNRKLSIEFWILFCYGNNRFSFIQFDVGPFHRYSLFYWLWGHFPDTTLVFKAAAILIERIQIACQLKHKFEILLLHFIFDFWTQVGLKWTMMQSNGANWRRRRWCKYILEKRITFWHLILIE